MILSITQSTPASTYPRPVDTAILGSAGGLLFGSELFKSHLASTQPRWTSVNSLDSRIRDNMVWSNQNLSKAALTSDILLYTVFLPSVFWVPAIKSQNYWQEVHVLGEVAVLNGIITQIIKFTVARQRPYAHFSAVKTESSDDNLSFFSGHTSFSFSLAVASSLLLSKHYPKMKEYIWAAFISLATFTSYLRIGADKHYFTDVLTGMIIGSTIGYLVIAGRKQSLDLFTISPQDSTNKETLTSFRYSVFQF